MAIAFYLRVLMSHPKKSPFGGIHSSAQELLPLAALVDNNFVIVLKFVVGVGRSGTRVHVQSYYCFGLQGHH